jgi:hypothetical protein
MTARHLFQYTHETCGHLEAGPAVAAIVGLSYLPELVAFIIHLLPRSSTGCGSIGRRRLGLLDRLAVIVLDEVVFFVLVLGWTGAFAGCIFGAGHYARLVWS